MSKESNSLWIGPTAVFAGICLVFFGGLWANQLATQSGSPWFGHARNLVFVFGATLICLGIDRIRKDGNDE